MKKLLIFFIAIAFTLGMVACSEAKPKEEVKKPEQAKEEVKKPEQTEVKKEEPKVSTAPQKKPEPKRSIVIFQSSTDGVWVIKFYADQKEFYTDALTNEQLLKQIPEVLDNFINKKEKK